MTSFALKITACLTLTASFLSFVVIFLATSEMILAGFGAMLMGLYIAPIFGVAYSIRLYMAANSISKDERQCSGQSSN